jgi:hypothetical protein
MIVSAKDTGGRYALLPMLDMWSSVLACPGKRTSGTGAGASKSFSMAAELMKVNPPQITDWSTLARLERIGIRVGESFDFERAPTSVRAGPERAVVDGLANLKAKLPTVARVVNGCQMNTDSMGVYGNSYLKRAIIAMVGLGANQPEDAIYPLCIADARREAAEGRARVRDPL